MSELITINDILAEKCENFAQMLDEIQQHKESVDEIRDIAKCIAACGFPDEAMEFANLSSSIAGNEDEREKMQRDINAYLDKGFHCIRCSKLGCDEEKILECHGKLKKNSKEQVTNSFASWISPEKIKKENKIREAIERVDDKIGYYYDGDKAVISEDEFIKDICIVAKAKPDRYQIFIKDLEDSKCTKGELGKLKKAVDNYLRSTKSNKASKSSLEMIPGEYQSIIEKISTVPDAVFTVDGWLQHETEKGVMDVSNCIPIIDEKLIQIDGINTENFYKISILVEGKLKSKSFLIAAKDIKNTNWLYEYFGADAILGSSREYDFLRMVAQFISNDAIVKEINYGLGWLHCEETNKWGYCFPAKCLGEDKITVAEMPEYHGYKYIESEANVKEAYSYFNKLFTLMREEKKNVMTALVMHTLNSVLITKLTACGIPPKYLVWLHGTSGAMKTSVSLVLASCFGDIKTPLANFQDTAAALEKRMYHTRDTLLLIDDFCPANSASDEKAKITKANIVTRNIGDRVSRSRAKSNMELNKSYIPRCNVLVTGEDVIGGLSTVARHLTIEMHRGDVDVDILSELQKNSVYLAKFMQYFILWVKENLMDEEVYNLSELFLEYREEAGNDNQHKRFAEMVAQLQLTYFLYTEFLIEKELIDEEGAEKHRNEVRDYFYDLAEMQNRLALGEDIADMFMTVVAEMIASGEITPLNPKSKMHTSSARTCCYKVDDYYYFIPGATYSLVVDYFQRRNQIFSCTERTLWTALKEKGYLEIQATSDRHADYKHRKNIGGQTIRVIQIKKNVLDTF